MRYGWIVAVLVLLFLAWFLQRQQPESSERILLEESRQRVETLQEALEPYAPFKVGAETYTFACMGDRGLVVESFNRTVRNKSFISGRAREQCRGEILWRAGKI